MLKYTEEELKELKRVGEYNQKSVYVIEAIKTKEQTAKSRKVNIEYFTAKTKAEANDLAKILKGKGYKAISIKNQLDELEF